MRLLILVLVVCCGLNGVARAAESEIDPLAKTFGAMPFAYEPRLSPDGSKISFLHHHEKLDAPVAIVSDIANGRSGAILASDPGEYSITWCDWANDERLLCGIEAPVKDGYVRYPITRLAAVNADGSNLKMLLQRKLRFRFAQLQDKVVDWLVDDPRKVLIQIPDDYGNGVSKLDIYSGKTERVLRPRRDVWHYLSDGRGEARLYKYTFDDRVKWYVHRSDIDDWDELDRDRVPGEPIGFGEDPNVLLFRHPHEGREALWSYDLTKGDARAKLVFSHAKVDVQGLLRLGKFRRAVAVSYITDTYQLKFFDEAIEHLTRRVQKTLPGKMVQIIDESWDRKFYLLHISSDTDPGTYYRFNVDADILEQLFSSYPDKGDHPFAPTQSLTYLARDGVDVPAYLTRPSAEVAGKLPAVILPHGGPSSRDVWEYDWLTQYLVAKGYVVLQPNYRGSSGYGAAWKGKGGFKAWRQAISDVTDGARMLVAEGVADPDRICMVGWSYGGYAALMSVLEEPELYQCAVSVAGVSDPELLWREARHFIGSDMTRSFVGSGDEVFEDGSPLKRAAEFMVPLLLVHGEKDYNVPVEHTTDLVEELQDHGKPFAHVIYEDVDHDIARARPRIDMLNRLGRFLDRHMGNDGEGLQLEAADQSRP